MVYEQTRSVVLSVLPKNATGAEIGVWKGDFSARILSAATPRTLHLIDPWELADNTTHEGAWYAKGSGVDMEQIYQGVTTRFAAEIASGQVRIHRRPSADALGGMADGSLDFIYVDGDHSYEAVRRDLDLSVAKVRPGGLICIDDHLVGKWWKDGIVRATNELLGAYPQGLMLQFASNSQVVIQKRRGPWPEAAGS